jgi:hypothetical protein
MMVRTQLVVGCAYLMFGIVSVAFNLFIGMQMEAMCRVDGVTEFAFVLAVTNFMMGFALQAVVKGIVLFEYRLHDFYSDYVV